MIEILSDPASMLLLIPTLLVSLNTLLKNMGMDSRICPVVNLVVGGFLAFPLFNVLGLPWYAAVLGSLMIGLSASGVYDLVQKTVRNQ